MTDGPFPVLASDRPGSKPDDPMAFIVPAVDLTFNSTVKAKNTWSGSNHWTNFDLLIVIQQAPFKSNFNLILQNI